MTIRIYEESDYEDAKDWWSEHGSPVVHKTQLPKLGVVVEDGCGPLAMAWVYMDNSTGIARLAWPVVKPGIPARKSYQSLRMAIDFLCLHVKQLGYGLIETTTSHEGLVKLFQKNDFQIVERDMTIMMRVL